MAIWRLWSEFDRFEPSALLSGIYAPKNGYHNYRTALSVSDYSRRLAADMRGSGSKASAIDLTLSDAAMRKYTMRLDHAARRRDPRLYSAAGPVLREFIGTLDSKTVYCYVLTGGKALGVNADAGPDPGRSKTHLWHIHLSIIRQFCEDWDALSGVLSVLMGQSLQEWGSEMGELETKMIRAANQRLESMSKGADATVADWGGDANAREPQWMVQTLKSISAGVNGIVKALPGVDEAVAAQLQDDLARLQTSVEATPQQVVAQLTAVGNDAGADALIAAVGEEEAKAFAEKVLSKLSQ
jgi:hypothetical protein